MLGRYKGRYVGVRTEMSMFSLERTKHISSHEEGFCYQIVKLSLKKLESLRRFKNLSADKSKMAAVIPLEFQSPDFKRHDDFKYKLVNFVRYRFRPI